MVDLELNLRSIIFDIDSLTKDIKNTIGHQNLLEEIFEEIYDIFDKNNYIDLINSDIFPLIDMFDYDQFYEISNSDVEKDIIFILNSLKELIKRLLFDLSN